MTDASKRAFVLSPARRALLQALLRQQGIEAPTGARIPRREVGGQAAGEPQALPLSFAQERIWFLDKLLPGNDLFNLSCTWRFTYPVDVDVLQQSLNEVVWRHESLRTTFRAPDGEPVQVVLPRLELPLRLVDLEALPGSQREATARDLATAEAQQPFDLEQGPLLRACLLHMRDDDYVFLVTMHHIVSDGWSLELFWDELLTIWTAFSNGEPSPLPDLPIQYADFAVWQRNWLSGGVLENQLGYWKRQLADLPVLQLPTDHPRPPVQTARGATHPIVLSSSLSARLKTLSRQEGVTLFMTILAAFQTLLHRYSQQDDIAVGTFIANRNRAETEELIGFFVNALVLRTDFAGRPTFRELLRQVRETTLEAYAHQDLPFAKLVRELQPGRDLSRNPLFQVAFQLLNVPGLGQGDFDLGEDSETLAVQRGTAILDLTVTFWESADRLAGEIEYNTDLFEAATIRRLAGHYRRLLESVVADPDRDVQRLPLLLTAEQRQVLVEWNDTEGPYPHQTSIVALFEKQVARAPDALALRCGGQELSFAELNRRANRLGRQLQRLGVRPEARVGICADRSPEVVVALLAILKAGGAYVPLDPSYPSDRLAYVVEDAGLDVLIGQRRQLERLPPGPARLLRLEEWSGAAAESEENLGIRVDADALAYVVYTSGSTGTPKGVAVAHRQLLNRLHWMWEAYPFAEGEVSCQKTALGFVDSLWELLGPLLRGVPSVVIPDQVARDPNALVQALGEARVSRIWIVPSLLRVLLAAHTDLGRRLPVLRFWVASGEALPMEVYELFEQRVPHATLYNLYGTSEVWDATWFDPRRDGPTLHCVPIGRPIANMQAFILDPQLQPVPIGVPGELHIGGVGLARGYLGRHGLTAGKFIPHPFGAEPGARLYKTGDLARFHADGNIEFLGRLDHQVKLRGFRIELGEVEAALARHPAVREAAVLLESDTGEPRLVGYVVLDPQGLTPEGAIGATLRRFLRSSLPEYMIPAAFVALPSLPLTRNGKLDRQALPLLGEARLALADAYVAPRTPLEEQLAGIWAQLLGMERIGIYHSFFELGGHSLLAIRALSRMREAFQLDIPLPVIFERPTVAGIAQLIEEARARGKRDETPAIVPLSRAEHATTLLPGGELDPDGLPR